MAECPQQKSPLHNSTGGVPLAASPRRRADPGRGQLRITEDLVGGPHGGIVHFCATDAKVCKTGWPGQRVYHFAELLQKLEDVKSRLNGLGSLSRVPGRRRVQVQSRIQSKVDGSSQSAGRVASSDLLPGILESQSDHKFKCEDDLRRHDGAGSDDFFEPELFHEASPRAVSNLLERSCRLPGRLLAEALSSMRSFLGPRGEADVSDQPRVLAYLETVFNQRYGKDAVGLRTSREMRTIAEAVDALVEGDVLRAGDLLIQRFKALETSVIDGTWLRARHHELVPEEGVGLASAAERQAISRLELQRRKLTEVVSKK